MPTTQYLLLFAVNLAFILTNLYGWILKWYYRPKAYNAHFHELFPAQRSVGVLYLMQIMELPYLLQVGDADALLYVNAFAVLFFSLQMLVMCHGYFFAAGRSSCNCMLDKKGYWLFLPGAIVLAPLLLQAVGIISLPGSYRPWAFAAVSVVFAAYFALSVRMALRIGQAVRRANEDIYADSDDFPVRFAQYIQWLPTCICVLMAINFYADNAIVKAVRDVIFTGMNIWFCIFTLNPWRQPYAAPSERTVRPVTDDEAETAPAAGNFRLTDERFEQLSEKLDLLLTKERIFTEQHITSDTLTARLGTNATYLSEVIRRSGYLSFYDMICQHRVRHAISLITAKPEERLLVIAEECGFSSPASMTKAFKQLGKQSPSAYRQRG